MTADIHYFITLT